MENRFKNALQTIKQANNILLVTHNKPDGDALSSICAVMELLTNLEKKFSAYCHDAPPHQFNFLPHVEKITNDKNVFNFSDFDLIIALDCGSLSRTDLTQEILNRAPHQLAMEIDHHPKIDDYADVEIRIPKMSSTAEVLYSFLKANKIKINKNLANCILTGILTDTGNLLYGTSEQTINISSEMLIYGARFSAVTENTYRNKSLPAMKIWGEALSNLQINEKYNFAYSVITLESLEKNEATEEELDGIANFLSNLYGVKGLLLFKESSDGKLKCSLRTNSPDINLSELAQILGGGGHAKASGFEIRAQIQRQEQGWKIV